MLSEKEIRKIELAFMSDSFATYNAVAKLTGHTPNAINSIYSRLLNEGVILPRSKKN